MQDVVHEILQGKPNSPKIMAFWWWAKRVLLLAIFVFVLLTASKALRESFDNDNFPDALAVKLELLPFIFPLHMFTGGMALVLVPLTLVLRGTPWHKWVGRLTATDILVAGLTAFPVALQAPVTRLSAAGFSAQALTWMTLLGFGLWFIRRGQVARHRACMLMMAAVASGAMFFRVYLALWKLLGWRSGFYDFYALDAWIAWGVPFLVMALLVKTNRLPRALGTV
jgi:hypothetical protein